MIFNSCKTIYVLYIFRCFYIAEAVFFIQKSKFSGLARNLQMNWRNKTPQTCGKICIRRLP